MLRILSPVIWWHWNPAFMIIFCFIFHANFFGILMIMFWDFQPAGSIKKGIKKAFAASVHKCFFNPAYKEYACFRLLHPHRCPCSLLTYLPSDSSHSAGNCTGRPISDRPCSSGIQHFSDSPAIRSECAPLQNLLMSSPLPPPAVSRQKSAA